MNTTSVEQIIFIFFGIFIICMSILTTYLFYVKNAFREFTRIQLIGFLFGRAGRILIGVIAILDGAIHISYSGVFLWMLLISCSAIIISPVLMLIGHLISRRSQPKPL